jgi:hypothetical protein
MLVCFFMGILSHGIVAGRGSACQELSGALLLYLPAGGFPRGAEASDQSPRILLVPPGSRVPSDGAFMSS